ncbi:uncharacterized protein LOC134222976 [Armigeres subalbatus]|uniref:uncharacterized protein LOC134222976 n=1 Tax=Armigeres subalbatus TaxID=124917 RepID=UPI002ED55EF1
MAVRRLRCLEKRFKANPAIFEKVQRQIVQYQQKGYIHEASKQELTAVDPGKRWYLPIGIVQNPKKPNKIRIVWDAAATVDGISLNNVLWGFRERKIAVVGDIMEMFHQLKMRREDRYSQLFLWPGENAASLKTFVIDVATFGSTSSPCSAQYVKNLNAAEHAEVYPRAAEAIERRHYVDDYLQSFDSEEEACQVVEEVKLVHRRGGFTIRNWLSNSVAVLRRVGEVSAGTVKIVDNGGSQIERVLGMQWMASEDVFVFSNEVDVAAVTPTKRGILRCLWATKFKQLRAIQIPRAYFPSATATDIEDLQLHIFVDGSETAYACVAYFRAVIQGNFHCALVGGKTKVAPLKALSIPRLELQAALIGCRLMKTLCNSHSLPISRRSLVQGAGIPVESSQVEPEQVEEEIRQCNVHLVAERSEVIDWHRFSKFKRLRRTVAYAHRFVDNCRRKILKQPLQSSHVNQEEFIKAENTLWRLAQQAEFPEEMFQLQQAKEGRKTKLDKTSRIYKLSPFIDEAGVARMDTRIAEAVFVSYDTKFPIILPKGHRLTNLVIEWYHRYYLHANNETVINEVRQRFHIPVFGRWCGISQKVYAVQSNESETDVSERSTLPEARLSPHIRPFSFVGLDPS